jgi:outer membrane protein OmpA-like peptidoglycan-associated protein
VAINLIEQLSREFSGDTLGRIASALGETENRVQSAIAGLAPAMVAALAGKAATPQGLADITDLMRTSGFDGSQPSGLSSLLTGGGGLTDLLARGKALVGNLFGSRQSGVTDWLSSLSGIGSRSASSLLAMATPVLLNLVGGFARKNGGFSLSSIGDLLSGQASFLRGLPAGLAGALGLGDAPKPAAPGAVDYGPPERKRGGWWPWVAALAVALLAWWWFAGREPAGTINPRVAIVNDEGRIVCSAQVKNEATREALLRALRSAFGQGTNCDITVDRNIRQLPWLPNADRIVAALKRPGTDFLLDGNSVRLGGWLSAADRQAILAELRRHLAADVAYTEAADRAIEYTVQAKQKALAALNTMGAQFAPETFINAMNLAVVNFATGSAAIPADAQDLIAKAASALKAAPKGTAIEVGGHTDNVGDAAANLKLSEERANAVRQALIAAGANGAMLTAKGYGDARPVASNDTEYGRFRNRRINYAIAPK